MFLYQSDVFNWAYRSIPAKMVFRVSALVAATRFLASPMAISSPPISSSLFDFWARKLLGLFKGKVAVTIEPHDARVLAIHPVANHPQLVAPPATSPARTRSRHGDWDGAQNRLRGTSATVAGDPHPLYPLWVYVPKGVSISQVRARTKGRSEVPVQHELSGNSLRMTFAGQPEPLQWEVGFQASATR
jgi:hypothetical protein